MNTKNPIFKLAVPIVLDAAVVLTGIAVKQYKKTSYNKKNNIYVLKPNKHFTPVN